MLVCMHTIFLCAGEQDISSIGSSTLSSQKLDGGEGNNLLITPREFLAQPKATKLISTGSIQFLSISSNFSLFMESKMIQAYLSYDSYGPG